MVLTADKNVTVIETEDDFDLKKIFTCGQCFRWRENGDGSFTGVALGRAARVSRSGSRVEIECGEEVPTGLWESYFDMSRDYRSAREAVSIDGFMREASAFGAGIRILNQDRWETLCSFIISQMNNIPRIKKIVGKLCDICGERTELFGEEFRAFPDAPTVAALSESDLSPLHAGYRVPYILAAARAVDSGALDLDALSELDYASAKRALLRLPGVGEKVANCVILFSLRIPDAFPIDVWVKRSLANHYPDGLDTSVFGMNAGLAQQYMFYYEREGGGAFAR